MRARDYRGFDRDLMATLRLVGAKPAGTAEFEFRVGEGYGNINGVMHGGAAALIFDMCTTSALGPVARPGFWECVFFFSLLLVLLPLPTLVLFG